VMTWEYNESEVMTSEYNHSKMTLEYNQSEVTTSEVKSQRNDDFGVQSQ